MEVQEKKEAEGWKVEIVRDGRSISRRIGSKVILSSPSRAH